MLLRFIVTVECESIPSGEEMSLGRVPSRVRLKPDCPTKKDSIVSPLSCQRDKRLDSYLSFGKLYRKELGLEAKRSRRQIQVLVVENYGQ